MHGLDYTSLAAWLVDINNHNQLIKQKGRIYKINLVGNIIQLSLLLYLGITSATMRSVRRSTLRSLFRPVQTYRPASSTPKSGMLSIVWWRHRDSICLIISYMKEIENVICTEDSGVKIRIRSGTTNKT